MASKSPVPLQCPNCGARAMTFDRVEISDTSWCFPLGCANHDYEHTIGYACWTCHKQYFRWSCPD